MCGVRCLGLSEGVTKIPRKDSNTGWLRYGKCARCSESSIKEPSASSGSQVEMILLQNMKAAVRQTAEGAL